MPRILYVRWKYLLNVFKCYMNNVWTISLNQCVKFILHILTIICRTKFILRFGLHWWCIMNNKNKRGDDHRAAISNMFFSFNWKAFLRSVHQNRFQKVWSQEFDETYIFCRSCTYRYTSNSKVKWKTIIHCITVILQEKKVVLTGLFIE